MIIRSAIDLEQGDLPPSFLLRGRLGQGLSRTAILYTHSQATLPVLVVVPAVLRTNWKKEIASYTKSDHVQMHVRGDLAINADWLVISFQGLGIHKNAIINHGFKWMLVDDQGDSLRGGLSTYTLAVRDVFDAVTKEGRGILISRGLE